MGDALLPFPLTERSVHLCVDMQRIFSAEGPWPAPWTERVLPVVASLAGRHPERTVFTRFIPAERPDQMPGMWQRYYTRWRAATQPRLKFAGVDAASGGPLPSSDRHRKDALFRLRRAKAARASARAGSGRPDYIGSETDVWRPC
jgi:nicotinamidase-related amidase